MSPNVTNGGGFFETPAVRTLLNLTEELEVPVLYRYGDNERMRDTMTATASASGWARVREDLHQDEAEYDSVSGFYHLAKIAQRDFGGHVIVAGENYDIPSDCQQVPTISSDLGQLAVIAKSFAPGTWLKLAQAGILPLEFCNPADYDGIDPLDILEIKDLWEAMVEDKPAVVFNITQCKGILVRRKFR